MVYFSSNLMLLYNFVIDDFPVSPAAFEIGKLYPDFALKGVKAASSNST